MNNEMCVDNDRERDFSMILNEYVNLRNEDDTKLSAIMTWAM